MRRIVIAVCLYLGVTATYAQQLGFHFSEKPRKSVTIPFELHNNLIIIPVVLNEQLPLKFVLDTGVRSAILVDKDLSDFLNLKYTRKYILTGVGRTKDVEAYITNNISLTLPGIHGEGHTLLVLEDDLLELKNYLGVDVHGILGYELFSRFVVEINYSRQLITFWSQEDFKPKRRYDILPMQVKDTKPYINGKLLQTDNSDVEVHLMIDTGSSQSVFIEQESDSANIILPDSTLYSIIGRGLGGEIKGHIGRVPGFELGSYVMEDIIINYPDPDTYIDKARYYVPGRNGTIGGDVLSRFNVIFDFPNGSFYFKKNSNFRKPFTYNLSGITVKAVGPKYNIFKIIQVRKNSAGDEAGVKKGDIIKAINGNTSQHIRLKHVNGFLNLRPNKKVRLRIHRNNEELKFKFRLRDLI